MGIKGSTLVPNRKTRPEIFFWGDCSSSFAATLRALVASRKRANASDRVAGFEWREHGPSRKQIPLLVVANLDSVQSDWAEEVRELNRSRTKFLLFAGNAPMQSWPERVSRLGVRDPHRMHIALASSEKERLDLVIRLVCGIGAGDGSGSILDAWWDADDLVVLSPEFERLRIPRAKLAELVSDPASRSDAEWENFRIHRNGAYIHWPEPDIHMSWEGLEQLINDDLRMKSLQASDAFNRRYGTALRHLRNQAGLSQNQIAGLTDRHVRRIESGEQRATSGALRAYAFALSTDVSDFMRRLSKLAARKECAPGAKPARRDLAN